MNDVFDSAALYQWWGYRVGQGSGAEQVSAMRVTPSFFRVLRGGSIRGRVFTEEEATPGKEKVAIVSQAFAEKQPEGIAGIVGKQLRLNDELHVVVGVCRQPSASSARRSGCSRRSRSPPNSDLKRRVTVRTTSRSPASRLAHRFSRPSHAWMP